MGLRKERTAQYCCNLASQQNYPLLLARTFWVILCGIKDICLQCRVLWYDMNYIKFVMSETFSEETVLVLQLQVGIATKQSTPTTNSQNSSTTCSSAKCTSPRESSISSQLLSTAASQASKSTGIRLCSCRSWRVSITISTTLSWASAEIWMGWRFTRVRAVSPITTCRLKSKWQKPSGASWKQGILASLGLQLRQCRKNRLVTASINRPEKRPNCKKWKSRRSHVLAQGRGKDSPIINLSKAGTSNSGLSTLPPTYKSSPSNPD